MQIVVYINDSGINQKICLFYVMPKKFKINKKFIRIHTYCTVYMGKLQDIKNFLSQALGQIQNLNIQIFMDNQVALKALNNLNICFAAQIM